MIRIHFKKPQQFNIGHEDEFTCMFLDAFEIKHAHKEHVRQCIIRYGAAWYNFYIYDMQKNNIKSIEHVKPTDI